MSEPLEVSVTVNTETHEHDHEFKTESLDELKEALKVQYPDWTSMVFTFTPASP